MALGATLVLAGCNNGMSDMPMGGDQTMAPSSSANGSPATATSANANFNPADVMFAQMMIPHHTQAVAMSDMLLTKSGLNADVQTLATQIKAAQQPEIEQLQGWLTTWGVPTMDPSGGGMGGMNDDGMATPEELRTLGAADGGDAQKLYLELMIKHHEGAIGMARAETANGKFPDAIKLARSIATTQQAEITQMTKLVTEW